jgi:hypothetical protein
MKKPVAKKQKPSTKEYNLTISFNDQIFTFDTDDLAESIMSVAPFQLKTRVLFLIKKGDLVCEKMLLLLQGRRLFMNKVALEVFINKLVFTKNG